MRRHRATTSWLVHPAGLSTTNKPSTGLTRPGSALGPAAPPGLASPSAAAAAPAASPLPPPSPRASASSSGAAAVLGPSRSSPLERSSRRIPRPARHGPRPGRPGTTAAGVRFMRTWRAIAAWRRGRASPSASRTASGRDARSTVAWRRSGSQLTAVTVTSSSRRIGAGDHFELFGQHLSQYLVDPAPCASSTSKSAGPAAPAAHGAHPADRGRPRRRPAVRPSSQKSFARAHLHLRERPHEALHVVQHLHRRGPPSRPRPRSPARLTCQRSCWPTSDAATPKR